VAPKTALEQKMAKDVLQDYKMVVVMAMIDDDDDDDDADALSRLSSAVAAVHCTAGRTRQGGNNNN